MSTVRVMGERFHPTEVQLINYLKRFLKGESFPSQCPIRLADIYGDQPPSAIFGEEKVGYFISPLKKQKESDERYRPTCGNGTWRSQTSGIHIENRKGTVVVGFRRNLKCTCKEKKQNCSTTWLMRGYFVEDDFFRTNDIPKHFVLCRIKKIIKEKKVKDVTVTEQDVAGSFRSYVVRT
ncbi:NAC domain-containing protein 6-like [Lycium barbarum]|uniref:NAC domain-containing protein 6-like n=1 Tax=Lycium barbarum TaxID=112863 RepID=UPI00293E9F93|nr:NAC domain-containing protein 6-like [Lycium barbarum]